MRTKSSKLLHNFITNYCSLIDKTDYATEEWIERVVILGAPSGIKGAKLTSQSMYL